MIAYGLLEPRFAMLEILQLSGNYIGPSLPYLVSSLFSHQKIKKLGLAWNNVTDAGAKSLVALLRKVKSLQHMDLRFNRIGDDGAFEFAKMFTARAKMERLDLSHNQIQAEGCKRLTSGIKKGKAEVKLKLDGNLGYKNMVLAHVVAPAVTVTPGPGGLMLPQFRDLVVPGWPRQSTTREGPRQGRPMWQASRGQACTPALEGVRSTAARTASAVNFGPRPWLPSLTLARNMSNATLGGMDGRRMWSRNAHVLNIVPSLQDRRSPCPTKS